MRASRQLYAGGGFCLRDLWCAEDTRLPKCAMFGELVGGAAAWGARKKSGSTECFLDDLRAFGINADQ